MSGFRVTVQGVEHSTRFFRSVPPAVQDAVRKVYQEHGPWVLRTLLKGRQFYPPERPGQRYRRTGELGDSWGQRQYGRYHVTFHNKTPYASYVVGDSEGKGQAWMHRDRWWLAMERIASANQRLIDNLGQAMKDTFKALGSLR